MDTAMFVQRRTEAAKRALTLEWEHFRQSQNFFSPGLRQLQKTQQPLTDAVGWHS